MIPDEKQPKAAAKEKKKQNATKLTVKKVTAAFPSSTSNGNIVDNWDSPVVDLPGSTSPVPVSPVSTGGKETQQGKKKNSANEKKKKKQKDAAAVQPDSSAKVAQRTTGVAASFDDQFVEFSEVRRGEGG